MDLKIVNFDETRVAALEHRGDLSASSGTAGSIYWAVRPLIPPLGRQEEFELRRSAFNRAESARPCQSIALVQRDSLIETEPLTRVPMVEKVKAVSRNEVDAPTCGRTDWRLETTALIVRRRDAFDLLERFKRRRRFEGLVVDSCRVQAAALLERIVRDG